MAIIKMKYGIDLGTTNSALCVIENGNANIVKTDTLKDTLPSCVAFTKKKIVKVGDSAFNDNRSDKARATKRWDKGNTNVFLEFKRTMGLDTTYYSSNMDADFNSEQLSAEVLKNLKSFVQNENIKSAVITIPAKFKTDQIAATKRAAELAGITHSELLQEPIAAAMAYGLKAEQKDGFWLVFDFGGGTFDAALLNVEDGILQVKDTEGDNYLGGKNLDYAIVDNIFIPKVQNDYEITDILADENKKNILRDALKFYAEFAKNQLSFKNECDITSQLDEFGEDDNGDEIELDFVVTSQELKQVLTPIFQKAVNICKNLLERNRILGSELDSLILVGGPTYSPILREMLKSQITSNIDTSVNPMTAVATGAALYASTIDTEVVINKEQENSFASLNVQYESNSVESQEYISVMLNKAESKNVGNEIKLELIRGDKAWSSGLVNITDVGDVIECHLLNDKANSFKLVAYDKQGESIKCYPNEITIIQGTKVGNAVLPYSIGIEVSNEKLGKEVFEPLKGLEKNRVIPTKGIINSLKVPKTIHPGNANERICIPIYQGEYDAKGSLACYNDHVFDVLITGLDVNREIPENSEIDITVSVDRSQMMKLEVMLHAIGETIEKNIVVSNRNGVNENELYQLKRDLRFKLDDLKRNECVEQSDLGEVSNVIENIENRYDGEISSDDGKMHLLADIRRSFLSINKIEEKYGIKFLHGEIEVLYHKIEMCNQLLGSKHNTEVNYAKNLVDSSKYVTDENELRETLKELGQVHFDITYTIQLQRIISEANDEFNQTEWFDRSRARQVIDKGLRLISSEASNEELRQVVSEILSLQPVNEKLRI